MSLEPEERAVLDHCAAGVTTLLERTEAQAKLCDERDRKINERVDEVKEDQRAANRDTPARALASTGLLAGIVALVKGLWSS